MLSFGRFLKGCFNSILNISPSEPLLGAWCQFDDSPDDRTTLLNFENLIIQLIEISNMDIFNTFHNLGLQMYKIKTPLEYAIIELTPTNLQPRSKYPEMVSFQ